MTEPRVTILMPAHNEGSYVGEAIESILHQDFESWRLWVLDDGSTDDTREVAEGYRTQDARIEVHASDENLGKQGILNQALVKVTTELCARGGFST